MTIRLRTATAALALAFSLGCSDSEPGPGAQPDATPVDAADAAPGGPADAGAPVGDCQAMQRDYVNNALPPDQQIDVATTVAAVLQAEDFPEGMPYCSGSLPDAD